MSNADNLKGKGFDSRSTEEVREIARKGGINSGAARRRKRNMKSSAKLLMDMPMTKQLKTKLKLLGISEEDATYQMGILVAMLQEALDGNVNAAIFMREMLGEDPKQEIKKKELKLKQDEFKHKKAMEEKAISENTDGTLVDEIIAAYNSRMEDSEDDG